MNKNIETISDELSLKIINYLMNKSINEVTYNLHKDIIKQLVLDYLKSNS